MIHFKDTRSLLTIGMISVPFLNLWFMIWNFKKHFIILTVYTRDAGNYEKHMDPTHSHNNPLILIWEFLFITFILSYIHTTRNYTKWATAFFFFFFLLSCGVLCIHHRLTDSSFKVRGFDPLDINDIVSCILYLE